MGQGGGVSDTASGCASGCDCASGRLWGNAWCAPHRRKRRVRAGSPAAAGVCWWRRSRWPGRPKYPAERRPSWLQGRPPWFARWATRVGGSTSAAQPAKIDIQAGVDIRMRGARRDKNTPAELPIKPLSQGTCCHRASGGMPPAASKCSAGAAREWCEARACPAARMQRRLPVRIGGVGAGGLQRWAVALGQQAFALCALQRRTRSGVNRWRGPSCEVDLFQG